MSDDLLRELGKELPYERPDEPRRDAVRASLLAAASRRDELRPQRWRVAVAFGAGAVAAAAVAILVIGRREPAPATVEHAQIEASAAAELEHTVATTANGTDEIVRVHTGRVRVAVAATRANERVAIETGDATVDGAGAYEVAVREDRLAAVTVSAGTARIVVKGQQAVFLAAGQAWHAEVWTAEITPATPNPTPTPTPTPNPTPNPTPTPTPNLTSTPTPSAIQTPSTTSRAAETPAPRAQPAVTTPAPRAQPAVTTPAEPAEPAMATSVTAPVEAPAKPAAPATPAAPDRTEEHFQRGWKLLRAGKSIEAAVELGLAADGEGPIAIDARYFQAEALVKAGRKTEAEKALVGFLDRAKQSLRRGRAAVMLARLIAERGDAASARAWFEAAVGDGDPAVAAAAKAGLAALH